MTSHGAYSNTALLRDLLAGVILFAFGILSSDYSGLDTPPILFSIGIILNVAYCSIVMFWRQFASLPVSLLYLLGSWLPLVAGPSFGYTELGDKIGIESFKTPALLWLGSSIFGFLIGIAARRARGNDFQLDQGYDSELQLP
jgi:hypothetical protein